MSAMSATSATETTHALVVLPDHKDEVRPAYFAVKLTQPTSMILLSAKTGRPLAGVEVRVRPAGSVPVPLLLAERPPCVAGTGASEFVALVQHVPAGRLEIKLRNYTPTMLKIDLWRTADQRVNEVDPGATYCFNRINELAAFRTYTMLTDQANTRTIELEPLTEATAHDNKTAQPLLVEAAEAKAAATASMSPSGVYVWPTVVPSTTHAEVSAWFAEGTVWKCADFLLFQTADVSLSALQQYVRPPPPAGDELALSQWSALQRESFRRNDHTRGARMRSPPAAAAATDQMEYMRLTKSKGMSMSALVGSKRATPDTDTDTDADADADTSVEESAPAAAATDATAASAAPPPLLRNSRPTVASAVMQRAQAVRATAGEVVTEHSNNTGASYRYDLCSGPARLCVAMTVQLPHLEPVSDAELLPWIAAEWAVRQANAGRDLLTSLKRVFPPDADSRCVLDQESVPDTIAARCGHQCVNAANLKPVLAQMKSCPICRGPITAWVTADGTVLGRYYTTIAT